MAIHIKPSLCSSLNHKHLAYLMSLMLSFVLTPTIAVAQDVAHEHPDVMSKEDVVIETRIETQSIDNQEEISLFEKLSEHIAASEKKINKFNLYLNMHGDFATEWRGSEFVSGKFQMRQLRIEAKGNINSVFSYRYRQRLNNGDNPAGYHDNIIRSIDYAAIGVKLGKWQLLLGKQCSAFGGIEFDLNPIEIYQYSDMIGSANNFLTGADVCYNFTPRQQVHVQIVNSNSLPTKDEYGDYQSAKMPLMYSVNWNGNFNDVFKTRWSASLMEQVLHKQLYFFALGNELNLGQFGTFFDWMYSREGVDRRGIITGIVGGASPERRTESVDYMTYIWHVNYRFLPRWNVFAQVMIENEGVYHTHTENYEGGIRDLAKGKYRTAWGYIAGIEYYPLQKSNLHFFVTYVGRNYKYTSLAKSFGASDYNTNRLSVGFIWQMPVF